MTGGRLCGFFGFQILVAWGETRSTEILRLRFSNTSEVPDSYMAEIPPCVGGSECHLVGIT